MESQKYRLKWKNQLQHFQSTLSVFIDNQVHCDVSFACGGEIFHAHQLVVTACSAYIREVLSNLPFNKHPIIFLQVSSPDIFKHLLDYMYKGETVVPKVLLPAFFKTCEFLKIQGLCKDLYKSSNDFNDCNNSSSKKSKRLNPLSCHFELKKRRRRIEPNAKTPKKIKTVDHIEKRKEKYLPQSLSQKTSLLDKGNEMDLEHVVACSSQTGNATTRNVEYNTNTKKKNETVFHGEQHNEKHLELLSQNTTLLEKGNEMDLEHVVACSSQTGNATTRNVEYNTNTRKKMETVFHGEQHNEKHLELLSQNTTLLENDNELHIVVASNSQSDNATTKNTSSNTKNIKKNETVHHGEQNEKNQQPLPQNKSLSEKDNESDSEEHVVANNSQTGNDTTKSVEAGWENLIINYLSDSYNSDSTQIKIDEGILEYSQKYDSSQIDNSILNSPINSTKSFNFDINPLDSTDRIKIHKNSDTFCSSVIIESREPDIIEISDDDISNINVEESQTKSLDSGEKNCPINKMNTDNLESNSDDSEIITHNRRKCQTENKNASQIYDENGPISNTPEKRVPNRSPEISNDSRPPRDVIEEDLNIAQKSTSSSKSHDDKEKNSLPEIFGNTQHDQNDLHHPDGSQIRSNSFSHNELSNQRGQKKYMLRSQEASGLRNMKTFISKVTKHKKRLT